MKNNIVLLLALFLLLSLFQGLSFAGAPLSLQDFNGTWLADYENSSLSYIEPGAELDDFMVIIDAQNKTMTMVVGESEETSTIEKTQVVGSLLKFSMDGFNLVMQKNGPNSMAIIDKDEIFVFNRAD